MRTGIRSSEKGNIRRMLEKMLHNYEYFFHVYNLRKSVAQNNNFVFTVDLITLIKCITNLESQEFTYFRRISQGCWRICWTIENILFTRF